MVTEQIHVVTLLFSIITGSAAGILSLLNLKLLRRSPFGRAVVVLSAVLPLFVVYHVVLLVMPRETVLRHLFESALYTSVALFICVLVVSQYRLRKRYDTR